MDRDIEQRPSFWMWEFLTNSGYDKITCRICFREFNLNGNYEEMQMHMREAHSEEHYENYREYSLPRKDTYNCLVEECGFNICKPLRLEKRFYNMVRSHLNNTHMCNKKQTELFYTWLEEQNYFLSLPNDEKRCNICNCSLHDSNYITLLKHLMDTHNQIDIPENLIPKK